MTIRDVFEKYSYNEQPKAQDVIVKVPIKELPNLDVIPSSILLFEVEEKITLLEGRSFILKNFLKRNKEILNRYDYILIDTNPSMSVFNINACYVADSIIISSDVSTNSINGAELFCSLWDAKRNQINQTADTPKEDNIAALIIGNYDKRTNMSKDLIKKNSRSRGIAKTIYFDADQYNKIEKFSKQLAKSENASKPSFSKALKIILDDYFK